MTLQKLLLIAGGISFLGFVLISIIWCFPHVVSLNANDRSNLFVILCFLGIFVIIFILTGGAKRFSYKQGEIDYASLAERTEVTLEEIKKLTEVLGQLALENVQRAMRFGGFNEVDKKQYFNNIMELMRGLDIDDDRIFAIADKSWHLWVEKDYVFLITGNQVPSGLTKEHLADWERIRDNIAKGEVISPNELRKNLQSWGKLDELRRKLVDDYEYYAKHKEHRNFERWHKMRKDPPNLRS